MAEARSAVHLDTLSTGHRRRASTGELVTITEQTLQETIYERPKSKTELFLRFCDAVQRSVKRWMGRSRNAFRRFLFPSTPMSWYVSCGSVWAMRSVSLFDGRVRTLATMFDHRIPYISKLTDPIVKNVGTSLFLGTGAWLVGTYISQKMLKQLLRYKGYLYDGPKSVSWKSRIWSLVLLLFRGFAAHMTHSYDSVLPSLPVPRLHDTIQRYLESMQPLLDECEFERLQRLAEDFEQNQGVWLQWLLIFKSFKVTNYVTDWWERFVYLRWREPVMINSNYYIMDARDWRPTNNQIARAANVTYQLMRFNTLVTREELPPLMISGMVPLCMHQYRRLFGTTRIPEENEDRLQTVLSKYVVVMVRGHFFALDCFDENGQRLSPCDLEDQLTIIMKQAKSLPDPGLMGRVAVLTGGDRDVWAEARSQLMHDRVSAASLEKIERAAFVLALDDEGPEVGPPDASQECPVANSLIHGNGANRWFDKSFTLVVGANGKSGLNVEHSWGDAPVSAHMMEWALAEEFMGPGYDNVTGRNKRLPQRKHAMRAPHHLKWGAIPQDVVAAIEDGISRAEEQIEDLDLRIFKHDMYSKGFIKRQGISPDAYIQMALQLAYYRDKNEFCQTYEASMTRLFAMGRTETVRPVSKDSCAFVRAMQDPSARNEDREALLRKAVDEHVRRYRMAMSGEGVDRHLFCLYVSAIWMYGAEHVPEFLQQVKAVPWALSTSQTPAQQTPHWDLKGNPDKVTGGGGFGPVADDGYGVSYIIATDAVLMLHVSSKKSSSVTNSKRFCDHIVGALRDMRTMLEANAAARKDAKA